MLLGLDIGSRSIKAVVLGDGLELLDSFEEAQQGRVVEAVRRVLLRVLAGRDGLPLRVGVTGCGQNGLSFPPEVVRVNDLIALAAGAGHFHPAAGSVLEVGGLSARWLDFEGRSSGPGGADIRDFALNDKCAAGAGAFLEQQASRLGLSLEEFSRMAFSARRGARVAGRCSVFAKSDMIHLQQKGTPVEEIAYGLCLALARNFESTVLRGKRISTPVALAGGGALNSGLRRALAEVFGLRKEDWLVGESPQLTCVWGAALYSAEAREVAPDKLLAAVAESGRGSGRMSIGLAPLGREEGGGETEPGLPPDAQVYGYLGVDVGSVSTNLAVLDEGGGVVAGVYLPTRGRPLDAVKEGWRRLLGGFDGRLVLRGIGSTGSGRYLAGRFLEADVIKNEITCQMASALWTDPEVDTIFEIGGQDSKYISVRGGRVHDFTMNKICAAGTGSFLEEQAGQLKVRIEGDFAARAASSKSPADLGSRCTVFMDSELAEALARGVPVEDIAAGLAYSVAKNYLEKVVAPRPVGRRVLFQGGVASNGAVVEAFRRLLDRPIQVHPFNRVSGAIGAALEARKAAQRGETREVEAAELGSRIERDYRVGAFECRQCSNRCQVNRVSFGGQAVTFGDACERYTAVTAGRPGNEAPAADLSEERRLLLTAAVKVRGDRVRIGLPRVSYLYEYLPFWAAFFDSLGGDVVLSPESSNDILESGLKKLTVDACLPVKLGYGHAVWFNAEGNVDWVFLPSLTQFEPVESREARPCPYGEHLAFMVKSSLDLNLVAPTLDFSAPRSAILQALDDVRRLLRKTRAETSSALTRAFQAQRDFRQALRKRGEEFLAAAGQGQATLLAVLGKPYNVHDPFLNMNLSRHLKRLGVGVVPYDFLPLEPSTEEEGAEYPVWRYNRLMIQAARWCLARGGIHPVLVTNFGCGPDAFGQKHLDAILADSPHLVLEFDEHRAEAGLVTRLEAFLDEVRDRPVDRSRAAPAVRPTMILRPQRPEAYRARRFFLPYVSDHIFAFSGAMKARGLEANVLPPPDAETKALGDSHSSGRECHAYALLTGDLIRLARQKVSEGVYYFPGTQYICLLQQYGPAMNRLLQDLGFHHMEVVAPPFAFLADLLGFEGLVVLWRGMVALDLLLKKTLHIRPYEVVRGETDRVHRTNLAEVERGLATYSLREALLRCDRRLSEIVRRSEFRPVVGIAGDIYTRQNELANNDLARRLEAMGCEVWPAPFFVDQMDFVFGRDLWKYWQSGQVVKAAGLALLDLRRRFERWRVARAIDGRRGRYIEPEYLRVIEMASPYIGRDNNDIVQLNVAKMADFSRRGADGIINVICFNCLLGTVSAALAGPLRRDHGHIPLTTLTYSGSDTAADQAKLEAFVHQVKRFAARRAAPPHHPASFPSEAPLSVPADWLQSPAEDGRFRR